MKVNFSKVAVQMTVEGEPQVVDLQKEAGNIIYSRSGDVATSDFGKKIYYKGSVEVPKELLSSLRELIQQSSWIYPVKKALLDLLTENKKENGTDETNAD
ncbi:hypothetical protein [Parabacteroides sp. Marseille-P3160]|uniref:hypothetical protein n=1 Tax=Parabacteroides sp. Marseille-P3160 TaxID=1917887 RepID=UPI0009B9A4A7|nr:hypothetical protein [Parabacteroides sp. Marseille-P3160]